MDARPNPALAFSGLHFKSPTHGCLQFEQRNRPWKWRGGRPLLHTIAIRESCPLFSLHFVFQLSILCLPSKSSSLCQTQNLSLYLFLDLSSPHSSSCFFYFFLGFFFFLVLFLFFFFVFLLFSVSHYFYSTSVFPSESATNPLPIEISLHPSQWILHMCYFLPLFCLNSPSLYLRSTFVLTSYQSCSSGSLFSLFYFRNHTIFFSSIIPLTSSFMAYQPIPGPSPGSGSSSSSGYQFINSPFGDTTYTKVFVGGLAWETQSETMRSHFEQFGEILEAVVIFDKSTGRSKGYGFVTFQDAEAARRACADPTPIIDGRRANCNLASLGRPWPPMSYGRARTSAFNVGSMQANRGPHFGNLSYQQSLPYNYQQGMLYPPYGYGTYGQEFIYSQGAYNPYAGQYFQIYGVPGAINPAIYPYGQMGQNGVPGAVNPAIYPYGQMGQNVPGTHGYPTVHGYAMPGHQILQFTGPTVNAVTASSSTTIQTPYPGGIAAPVVQPQFVVPASPQFVPGSGSDQSIG